MIPVRILSLKSVTQLHNILLHLTRDRNIFFLIKQDVTSHWSKNHKPYYKDNFHAYMHIKQTLLISCKTICWCYVIVSIKCCKVQLCFIYIYKHTNCQGTLTFSKYFERETWGPAQMLTNRSVSKFSFTGQVL